MELEDMKSIWQKGDPFQLKLEEEITTMLRGSSNSIISKLKRSVWFELIFTIIAGLILLYYSFTIFDNAIRWSLIAILIMFLCYIIYYVKKINLLKRFEGSSGNIKDNLENLISDLNTYLKFYKKSYSLLYPIYLVLILFFIIMDRGMEQFIESLKEWKMILYLAFLMIVFIITSFWLTSWYLRKLYGNHLEKLKSLLDDIHDASP